MQFSLFGERFLGDLGITKLMEDLGCCVESRDQCMLGGGNPAAIQAVNHRIQNTLRAMLDEGVLLQAIARYDGPRGKTLFIEALAKLLRTSCGWDIQTENIALTNGSQNLFFYLFNLFSGPCRDGPHGQILLPLVPEYIGYMDAPLSAEAFVAVRPKIQKYADCRFKYELDRNAIIEALDRYPIRLICASRPTNPSGNMLTDDEVHFLYAEAYKRKIPLLLDYAYGAPFPNIVFIEAQPFYAPGCIATLSLSKLGLPGMRCGIVIADIPIIEAINRMNSVINLAPGGLGPMLGARLCSDQALLTLSKEAIQPYYRKRVLQTEKWLDAAMKNQHFHLHGVEGGFFLWVWFADLSISSMELYARCKARGAIVVSGHYFFPPSIVDWAHTRECIRINASASDSEAQRGIAILAEEVQRAWAV